jgi:hypothetical protein
LAGAADANEVATKPAAKPPIKAAPTFIGVARTNGVAVLIKRAPIIGAAPVGLVVDTTKRFEPSSKELLTGLVMLH